MSIQKPATALNRAILPLMKVITFISGINLMLMMVLITCDVLLRFFNHPISGTYELTEYSMALAVSFGITVCAHQGGHINVDILTNALKKRAKTVLASLMALVAIGYTIPIMWQSTLQIQEVYSSHVTSAVLRIAVYPFTIVVAISFVMTTIVFIVEFINLMAEMKTQWTR